jgi:hypothetical protein
MVETDEAVIDEIVHEGETLTLGDLFERIEQTVDGQQGVPRAVVTDYAHALADRRDYAFDAEGFLDTIDERLTDADTWAGIEKFYALDGDRISKYPSQWHADLGGSTDAEAYVRYIAENAPEFNEETGHGGPASALPEDTLIEVIATVGRVDKAHARRAIEEARDRGDVVEDADQHPHAGLYLPEDDLNTDDT